MNKKEKFKQLKSKNGITLIALVVTIIVLIILAAVSINLVLGDNGIITKAKEGKQNTELAKEEEVVQLNEAVEYLENLGGSSTPTIKPGESGYQGGNYDDPYIPIGFSHTEGTWNGGYTIKDGLGNEFVWVPCVTDSAKIKEGDNVELFKKTTEGKYNEFGFSLSPTDTTIKDTEPTEAIRTSVGTYGGFYIAKYESGVPVDEDGNEIASTSATATQKARSVSGATAWTDISRTNAIVAAQNMVDSSVAGVNSGLISGECWDTTLKWMVNTSDNALNEPNAGYDIDSTENGWYSDASNRKKTTTGQYPINNIYDMAGNVYEWTTENCTDIGYSYLVVRGGPSDNSGSLSPAASRVYSYDSASNLIAFRVVLYK